ncbi:hypothetical protein SDC9_101594 [bioreactor metagenome]|uniref:HTH cro/C1-type domain-containing protein n=1 Tax=bioreactor metagenome TaxID=1076179 RepID=A0A645ANI7_9ZZZZ
MKSRNVLGPRICLIRKEKGITQDQLAARLNIQGINIDRPMVSKIETQNRELLDYEIVRIATALDISIDELFNGCALNISTD